MNLKTSLQMSAVYPIVLAIVVCLCLFIRTRQISDAEARVGEVVSLSQAANQLQLAVSDLQAVRDEAAIGRCVEACSGVRKLVETAGVTDVRRAVLFQKTISVLDRIAEELKMLPTGDADMATAATIAKESLGLQQGVDSVVAAEAEQARQKREHGDILFAVFIGIMGLLMAAAALSTSRDVVRRTFQLGHWTRIVSEGNLDVPVDISGRNDEIGQLTRTFSDMTKKLKVAYSAMESEIEEHKKDAEALRASNVLLSSALEKLKRAQHQIVQQERLHVLEQVVRGVAHDFNNTLTPILGMSDFLLTYPQKMEDKALVLDNLTAIRDAAQRSRSDVKRLAEFFRPLKDGDMKPVDLNEVIKAASNSVEPKLKRVNKSGGKPIAVEMALTEIPKVAGNASELREAITNLIMNAVEAMPGGGKIQIKSGRESGFVKLDIIDEGEGMSEELKTRCLEPFFSTKGVDGTGMGLTIVSTTVKHHGGKLSIASCKGKGTTVSIILPEYSEEKSTAEIGDVPPIICTRDLDILVIDDESWSRDIVSMILRNNGHHVDLASSGREGIDKGTAKRYDVIITDRAMPDVSGDDVAIAIKQKWPDITIMLLTGFGDIMLKEGAKPEGVDVIVSKPITAAELEHALYTAVFLRS